MPLEDLPELAHRLLDVADPSIALFDPSARLTACNDGFLDVWQMPRERALGNTLGQLGLDRIAHDRLCPQIKYVASSVDVLNDTIAIDRFGAAAGDFS